MGKRYNEYHKHSHRSNIYTPDSHVKNEDYAKRAVELGHTTLFSTEHGYGGSIFETVTLAETYGLKPIYAIEGYIVADASTKDSSNYHIVIIPKNDEARKQLNKANSRANMVGYYYKPRLFLSDLLEFNKDDLYLTTACCGGLLKDEESFRNIFLPLYNHFKENIFLEVQTHNVESQKDINRRAKELKRLLGLKLIHANDSHYIYPEDAKDRLLMLKGKGITYGEEDSYILDYPDYDTILMRYRQQGVLSEAEAEEALDNTLIFDDIENIKIDKLIKMPNIYKDLSVEGRVLKLKQIVARNFRRIASEENIIGEELNEYIKALNEEMKVIEETKEIHSMDYFLFNERMVDKAVNEYGGYLTPTGRGSGGAFLTNKMLGLTQLDRMRSEIPLYPERFMSSARLLGDNPPYTSSLPDFDFNIIEDEPFVKASRDLLGKYGCYAFTAYGTMGESEAFRNTCRAKNLDYDTYNEVAKDLDKYREDEYWKPIIEESNKFNGVIISASIHPCAYLLMDKDLREELGVIKIGDAYCCPITSVEADEWHYLKNDYLKVESISLAKKAFDLAEVPVPTIYEFKSMLDNKVWDIYAKGITCTINQYDSDWATSLCKKYKPCNVKEVAMFNGAIRPNFNDYRDSFVNRLTFTNGNEFLDKLFEPTDKFILYQENLMQFFEALGVKPSESIGLIKKISKKKIKPEMFEALTERLKAGWMKAIGNMDDFDETWENIQTFMSYGYNTPHSLAMAYDSLYEAYPKAHYPLAYYTVALEMYKDDERRTTILTKELEYFKIKLKNPRFRYSKADYMMDKETNSIYKGISSYKYLNEKVGEELYYLRNNEYPTFMDLLIDLQATSINSRQLDILIRLDFFEEFGGSKKLLGEVKIFEALYGKKVLNREKLPLGLTFDEIRPFANKITEKQIREIDILSLMNYCEMKLSNEDLPLKDKFEAMLEYQGFISYKDDSWNENVYAVLKIKTNSYGTPFVTLYNLNKGEMLEVKVYKKTLSRNPLDEYDIIYVASIPDRNKKRMDKSTGEWITLSETEKILETYRRVL